MTRPILKDFKETDERTIHLTMLHNVSMCGNCCNINKTTGKCKVDQMIHSMDAIGCRAHNIKIV